MPLPLQVYSGILGFSGYYLAPLAVGIIWQPWLSRYCLAPLALQSQKIGLCLQKFIQGKIQKVSWLSGYCLVPLGSLDIVWYSWLSENCLASKYFLVPLALWVLSGALGSPFIVLHPWVFSGALGSSSIVWHPWLSRYFLVPLVLRVLSGTLGSPGVVWWFWLSEYCLVSLAL